jgi:hypothetical protein
MEFDKFMKQKIARAIFWLIFAFCVFSLFMELKRTGGSCCPFIGNKPAAVMEKAK